MRRQFFGIFLGMFLGFLTLGIGNVANSAMHVTADYDVQNQEELKELMDSLPDRYFLISAVVHAAATFLAGFVANVIRGRLWLTGVLVPAGIFFLLSLAVLEKVPHPAWFRTVDLSVYLPAAALAFGLSALLFRKADGDGDINPGASASEMPQ